MLIENIWTVCGDTMEDSLKLLGEYLDRFSWSQAELARQADVSVSTVGRAMRGDPITRDSAMSIIEALDAKHRQSGGSGHITKRSLRNFHTTPARRRKKRAGRAGGMTEEEQAYKELTGQKA